MGLANVTWTSPINGVVDISGAVWMGRDIGRANDWRLYLNGGLLTGGSIWSGDPYSRASPFTFESGDPPTVTELTEATDWEEWFPIRNGRQYSGINLIGASAATNAAKELRANVEGYEEIGDGSGLLITNPALAFLHFLANFVFNKYQSGLWFSSGDAQIDLDRFLEARDFFNLTGQAISRYIGGKGNAQTIKQEVNRWSKSLESKIWWNHENEIAIGVNDPFTLDVYPDRDLEEGLHDLSKAKYRNDGRKLLNKIFISYLRQEAANAFLANVTVEDTEVTDGASENIQAFWLPSSLPQYIASAP
jgi:hypothetical protein